MSISYNVCPKCGGFFPENEFHDCPLKNMVCTFYDQQGNKTERLLMEILKVLNEILFQLHYRR